jgi:ribokinase
MFDVVTIGVVTRDIFIKSNDFSVVESKRPIAEELECLPLGAKIEVNKMLLSTGGGATNAATTFVRQGLHAACITKIGGDEIGKELLASLQKEGIDTSLVRTQANAQSAESVILINAAGERSILVYRGSVGDVRKTDIDFLTLQTKWISVFSLAGDLETLRAVVAFAQEHSVKIAWNPGAREIAQGIGACQDILAGVAILVMNREEAAAFTGRSAAQEEEFFAVLRQFTRGVIVITDGSRGVMVNDSMTLYQAGIFTEQKIEDRTGAGDAFGSGFTSAIIAGMQIPEAIRLASANATAVVEAVGAKTGILTKEAFLADPRWRQLPVTTSPVFLTQ